MANNISNTEIVSKLNKTKNIYEFINEVSFTVWTFFVMTKQDKKGEELHNRNIKMLDFLQTKLTQKQQKLLLCMFKQSLTGYEDKYIVNTDLKTLKNILLNIKNKLTKEEHDDIMEFLNILKNMKN